MSSLASKQLANAHAYLKYLRTDSLDWDAFADLLAPDFEQKYLPASMAPPAGKFTRTKEENVEFLKTAWETWANFQLLPPIEVIQGTDVVVIHIQSDGTPKDDSRKQYNNEYILIFRFAGEKIASLGEFVDSKYTAEYFGH
ncbi:hypothetical protein FB45DRAFT_1054292 [Roridomyces roridus]|uniref:SnoaL-like domain-containing protein n=1 Tax=Roridomyces roridus TaxID=1738132 RepID=A0AAD7C8L7_9AGAR|nr:hypothetical protein FB45DRAFT_1054292 [Roridomyces roridus]